MVNSIKPKFMQKKKNKQEEKQFNTTHARRLHKKLQAKLNPCVCVHFSRPSIPFPILRNTLNCSVYCVTGGRSVLRL